ncbi:hypothetical protein LTS18_012977, partial [Coniosporium uncinatum]
MSLSEDLINFDAIEEQKENIQSLPSGRSAKALAALCSPPPCGRNHTPQSTQDLNNTYR